MIHSRIRRNYLPQKENNDDQIEEVQKIPEADRWSPVVPSQQIGLLQSFYLNLQSIDPLLMEDDDKPKTKEAKQMIKFAQGGGRKKPTLLLLQKKKSVLEIKKKDQKKKKEKIPKELKEKKRVYTC